MDNLGDVKDIELVFKGIITGILAIYVVIYALRPAVIYPDYVLDVVDNPWVFVILLIINYYVFLWDATIAILMLLTLIAMFMDVVLFTEGFKIDMTDIKSITGIENMANAMNSISDNAKDYNSILLNVLQAQQEERQEKNKESPLDALRPKAFI